MGVATNMSNIGEIGTEIYRKPMKLIGQSVSNPVNLERVTELCGVTNFFTNEFGEKQ